MVYRKALAAAPASSVWISSIGFTTNIEALLKSSPDKISPLNGTELVAAKEACWRRDGLGHWAILANGAYAGWGGFQKEGEDWDFGLVLSPGFFGLGQRQPLGRVGGKAAGGLHAACRSWAWMP